MPVLLMLVDTATQSDVPGTSAGDIVQLVVVLVVMVAIVVAAYWVTRMIAGGTLRMQRQAGRMRTVDRMMLAKDKAVVVVELDGKYYMLGVGSSISMLGEVDGAMYRDAAAQASAAPGFLSALQDKLRPNSPPPYEGPVGEENPLSEQEDLNRAVERMRARTQQRWKRGEEKQKDE